MNTPKTKNWRIRAYEAARQTGKFGNGILVDSGPEKAAEAWKKAKETRCANIARDRRRISIGLEPLSKLVKFVCMTKKEIDLRSRMKSQGYIVLRNDSTIYYNSQTKRSKRREATASRLGILVTLYHK